MIRLILSKHGFKVCNIQSYKKNIDRWVPVYALEHSADKEP